MVATHRSSIIIGLVGMVIWMFGIILFFCFPFIFDVILYKELPIQNNSLVYNLWKDIPIPLYQSFYFFNVENPSAFLRGAKLNITQKGPYVYKSWWYKKDLNFYENDTISYREVKTYYFMRNMSVGPETDRITTLNVPLLVAGGILKNASFLVKFIASFSFDLLGQKLFVRRSVGQLTYKGYDDILMQFAPLINPKIPDMNGKFGYLYGKNGTDEGLFNVFTGKSDLAKFNVIDRLNGKKKLDVWKRPICNMINGTNGELNPPLKYTPGKVHFFQTLLCRTWTLVYQKQVPHYGLSSYRYIIDPKVFANASEEPDNSCYYPDRQFPYGVTGIAPCQFDAPVYLSSPHFYLADPSFRKNIRGLNPNPNEHEFHIDIEPYTGLSVDLSAKFQVNIYLSRVKDVKQLSSVPQIMFPIFWQDLSMQYTDHYAKLLESQVYIPIQYTMIGCYTLISFGGALIVVTLLLLTKSYLQRKQAQEGSLIDEGSPASEDKGTVNPALEEDTPQSP